MQRERWTTEAHRAALRLVTTMRVVTRDGMVTTAELGRLERDAQRLTATTAAADIGDQLGRAMGRVRTPRELHRLTDMYLAAVDEVPDSVA